MYLHPEMPSYQDQIDSRDRMLAKHKNLPFLAAHLASLEWSVDELAKFLDRFPNAVVGVAERLEILQHRRVDQGAGAGQSSSGASDVKTSRGENLSY